MERAERLFCQLRQDEDIMLFWNPKTDIDKFARAVVNHK